MPVDTPPAVEAPAPDTVVVRAARLPPSPADAAYAIKTLDTEQLTASDRLDEALQASPGLSLFRRTTSLGANPTTQGLSLRSFAPSGAGRALVTLDGVPQNDPFGGWVIWTALPAESLEQARIVRGAGAGPYGAGALTGVVALDEMGARPGAVVADVSGGELGYVRGAGAFDTQAGPINLLLVGGGEHDDGWIPAHAGRGAADTPLYLDDWNIAARAQANIGPAVLALRGGAFEEDRGAGFVGAYSRERGDFFSATLAAPTTAVGLGWRLQAWVRQSNLLNESVAVAAGHVSTTPANDQYSTPATGYGVNAAVRRETRTFDLEAGVDVRGATGDSHENFRYLSGAFTRNRDSGGDTLVAGAYVDADKTLGAWLLTGGVRADYWSATNNHRVEHDLTSGAVTLNDPTPDRSGVLPTARLGVRRNFDDGLYLRAAAYAGFRPATLNELHRPFRVGNNVTEANSLLRPERLFGVEAGVGGEGRQGAWNLTVFSNRLEDAITNVTIGVGPGTFPVAGLIPAGGILYERMNAGAIEANGLEGEADRHFGQAVELRLAGDWTVAKVDGGSVVPQLTGKQPAEAPRVTLTAAAIWRPISPLKLQASLRYESARYEDDLNTLRLNPATTLGLEARWKVRRWAELYLAADNVTNANVQTGEPADHVFSYGEPRMVRVGLSLRN